MNHTIQKTTLDFLRELSDNNNKPWFLEQKDRYTLCHENMIDFAEALRDELSKYDILVPQSGRKILFRIYRDVRFSKDKTPYKSFMAGSLKRATDALRGGYYFSVQPGRTFIGGGFWNPNSKDLARIRHEIAHDTDAFRAVFNNKDLIDAFGRLQGDQVKTSPKGYRKDDPAIDLLRFKNYYFGRHFTDKEVMHNNFVEKVSHHYNLLRPWFDLMSDVLTTDVNGVSTL